MVGVLDVAGPADDQLFAGGLERTDAADHSSVSIADGDGPLGGSGGVVGFRQRNGVSLGLHGKAADESRFGGGCLRRTREAPLGGAVRKRRYDGKIVAHMEDTTGEFDALRGEICLLLEDVFADVLERDLGWRKMFREAVHDGGRGGRRGAMERERVSDWRVL